MVSRSLFLLALSLFFLADALPPNAEQLARPLSRLAFGSCNKPERPQDYWKNIAALDPDVWVWLGDVIYADRRTFLANFEDADPSQAEAIFHMQKQHPFYQQFLKQFPVVGVWDDHDSCKNNAGAGCPTRRLLQPLFLDFMDEPAASPRRHRPSKAIYTSYTWGQGDKQAKLILLDTRSLRGAVGEGDVLGEEQWQWLEQQLQNSTAKIHLIASGIQVTTQHRAFAEKWSAHPGSFDRLLDMLARYHTPGVIFLSGDVHFSELLKYDCSSQVGYPLYEITSSGLTHCCHTQIPLGLCHFFLNSFFFYEHHRIFHPTSAAASSRWARSPSFNLSTSGPLSHDNSTQLSYPYPSRQDSFYAEKNFGLIEIDWDAQPVRIHMQIRRTFDGLIMLDHEFSLDEITPSTARSMQTPEWCSIPVSSWKHWPLEYYVIILAMLFLMLATSLSLSLLRCLCKLRVSGSPAARPKMD